MRRCSLVVAALALSAALAAATLDAQAPAVPAPATTASPQSPPRAQGPTGAPRTGTAVIRGVVVAADTGAPLRRVTVRAISPETGDVRSTRTDEEGRFALTELVGGRYTVSATKAGFVTVAYGQRQPREPVSPVTVAAGQTIDKVVLALPRGGVIAGRVLDERGDPVIGAQVMATHLRPGTRGRALGFSGPGSSARTDDQGAYRLWGLMPGDYVVSATVREESNYLGDRPDASVIGYAPTYYPGTPAAGEAQRLAVVAGQETPNVVFALTPARLSRVRGRVITSAGTPARDTFVEVRPAGDASDLRLMTSGGPVREQGDFELRGLAPGRYLLRVRLGDRSGAREFGQAAVTVNGSDVDGVVVTTSRGITLSGQVTTDDGVPPSFAPGALRIAVTPAVMDSQIGMFAPPPPVNGDWTFAVSGVFEPVLVRTGGQPGWTLKAVYLDGQDVTDTPIDPRGGDVGGLQIVLSSRVTELSGTITDNRGAPSAQGVVVIFADDETKWTENSRFVRTARPDQAGLFRFRALPPGRYLMATVQAIEDGQVSDPDFLQSLRPGATAVTLGEGETKSLALRTR